MPTVKRKAFRKSGQAATKTSTAKKRKSVARRERGTESATKKFAICVSNKGYEASLEKFKIYVMLKDKTAEAEDLVRIVDESGEDYLYPASFFCAISLPNDIEEAVLAAA